MFQLRQLQYLLVATAIVCAGISSAEAQRKIDRVSIALTNAAGQYEVQYFNGTGAYQGTVPIPSNLDNAELLAGLWLPNSQPSVAAITDNFKQRKTVQFITTTGVNPKKINLGKQVMQILKLDYDGSGIADLAVQTNRRRIRIYLDPFAKLAAGLPLVTITVKAPRFADAVVVPYRNRDTLGFVTGFGSKISFRRNPRRQQRQLQYTNELGQNIQIKLARKVSSLQGVRTADGRINWLEISEKSINPLASPLLANGQSYNFNAQPNITATFLHPEYTSIVVHTGSDTLHVIHPFSPKSDRIISVNFQDSKLLPIEQTDTQSDFCIQYDHLLARLANLLREQLFADAYLVATQLDQQKARYNRECDSNFGEDELFLPSTPRLISSQRIVYESNSDKTAGPCDQIQDGFDGRNGFLAKNSDHGGIVYLTPWGYGNGRILHPKTLRVIEGTRYTGIANGGRAHFRTGGRLPRGRHIFAADKYGQTMCWKIPGNRTRVD